MKKLTTVLTLSTLLFSSSLSAQNTGDASAKSFNAGKDNTWKNWAYAGGAVIAAAVGITIVLLSQGSSAPSEH